MEPNEERDKIGKKADNLKKHRSEEDSVCSKRLQRKRKLASQSVEDRLERG